MDNESLLCYSKQTEDRTDIIVVVANLDRHYTKSGWVDLPLDSFGLHPDEPFHVRDLLTNTRYTWRGPRNYIELGLSPYPAHIFYIDRALGKHTAPPIPN